MLVRFTQIDYHDEMALIAVNPDGEDNSEEKIGVVRYMTNLDKVSCEFALVVSDKWQSRGVARQLMQKLIEIARDRDLKTMEGQVLGNNFRMLGFMQSLGFKVGNDPTEPGIKLAKIRLN